MVDPCLFILCGADEQEKDRRIEDLQKKFFPPELKELNYTLLHADDKDLTPQKIKEALWCAPTPGAQARLFVLRQTHRLPPALKGFLVSEIAAAGAGAAVVLDVVDEHQLEALKAALKGARPQVVRVSSKASSNVFDLGRAILGHRPDAALKILSGLLRSREKTEKILGAIFWQWERFRDERRLSDEVYREGLKILAQADKRLKSSSSVFGRTQLILESLVVRLSYLA
jgi:DNA polymerase III delta subunit